MKTTLNKIKQHDPNKETWAKLLTHFGKTKADDEPLSLITILDAVGLEEALWCLQAVDGYDREKRLYAVWCARQLQHLMKDPRSLDALAVAERYAHGDATKEELASARAAAWAAAWAAAKATRDDMWAARAAAWAAGGVADAGAVSWPLRAAVGASSDAAGDALGTAWAAYAVHGKRDTQEAKFREMFGGDV